jgi:hypothetical protein
MSDPTRRSAQAYRYDVKLSSATRGRVAELVVQLDLLERGWEVFGAVSPACKCDLMISRPGDSAMFRVEVKTAKPYRKSDGTLSWYTSPLRDNVFDILAVVRMPGHEITYTPPLPDGLTPWMPLDGP